MYSDAVQTEHHGYNDLSQLYNAIYGRIWKPYITR